MKTVAAKSRENRGLGFGGGLEAFRLFVPQGIPQGIEGMAYVSEAQNLVLLSPILTSYTKAAIRA